MERLTGCAPEQICAHLRKACAGCVEMVNSRGVYLQLGERRILLCHSGYGTVPNGIALDGWEHVYSLLAAGQPVRAEKGMLFFPCAQWELQLRCVPRDTHIHIPDEKGLGAGLDILLANTKQTGLASLAYPLFTGQMPPMNLCCQMALNQVSALLQALQEENTDTVRTSVSALLGLGPGLTPSGDDLLSGLLYGLRHSGARDTAGCIALTDAIREMAVQRTNAVSADYLLALADDAPFDLMAAAWEDPAAGAAALIQVGSNSGTEMLLGLLCAGVVTKKPIRQ